MFQPWTQIVLHPLPVALTVLIFADWFLTGLGRSIWFHRLSVYPSVLLTLVLSYCNPGRGSTVSAVAGTTVVIAILTGLATGWLCKKVTGRTQRAG